MKQKFSKSMTVLFCLMMMLMLIPAGVFAAGETWKDTVTLTDGSNTITARANTDGKTLTAAHTISSDTTLNFLNNMTNPFSTTVTPGIYGFYLNTVGTSISQNDLKDYYKTKYVALYAPTNTVNATIIRKYVDDVVNGTLPMFNIVVATGNTTTYTILNGSPASIIAGGNLTFFADHPKGTFNFVNNKGTLQTDLSVNLTLNAPTPPTPTPPTPTPDPEPEPPAPGIDHDQAMDDIGNAKPGATVPVPVKPDTAISKDIFEAAVGKDIVIDLDYDTYKWEIDSKTITGVMDKDYNLTVTDEKDAAITDLIVAKNSLQIKIAHDGALPFTGVLNYPVTTANGKTLHLYYFNPTSKKLDYQESAEVKGGKVKLNFTHASHYVLLEDLLPVDPVDPTIPSISYRTHVENLSWQAWAKDGALSGTSGKALRLEGIEIKMADGANLGVSYSTHIQDIGWQAAKVDGEMSGTEGQAKRLEAIKINLTGADKDKYDLYYRVHTQNAGWLDWAKNGQEAGTSGLSFRLEAIEIKVVAKGAAAPGTTARPFINGTELMKNIAASYSTHVENIGWQAAVNKGAISGTEGQALRLEGIKIDLLNASSNMGIQYKTHIQDIGWESAWKANGITSGTEGQAKRLEAIQIQLTGTDAVLCDVYYQVHAENYGWLGWAKNGESAGTAGHSYRLEAIKVVVVPKGGAAPGSTADAFMSR